MKRNEKSQERREIEEFKRTERILLEKIDQNRLLKEIKSSNLDTQANLDEEEKNLLDPWKNENEKMYLREWKQF